MFHFIARGAVVLLSVLVLSGCAITDEFNRQGGFADRMMDYIMPADSRQHRVFRAYLILGILTRVASESPVNLDDREAVAFRIEQGVQASREAYNCAKDKNCAFLEDRLAILDRRLFRLAVMVLYPEETRDFLARVREGMRGKLPVIGRAGTAAKAAITLVGEAGGAIDDIAGAINGLLDLSFDAYRYGQRLGPLYRDTVELDMRIVKDEAEAICDPKRSGEANYKKLACTIRDKSNQIYNDGTGKISDWHDFLRGEDTKKIMSNIEPDVKYWVEASDLIWRGCDLLVRDNGDKHREKCRGSQALIECRKTVAMRYSRSNNMRDPKDIEGCGNTTKFDKANDSISSVKIIYY